MDQDSTNNYNNKQATRTQIKIERQANKRQEKMSEKNRKKARKASEQPQNRESCNHQSILGQISHSSATVKEERVTRRM